MNFLNKIIFLLVFFAVSLIAALTFVKFSYAADKGDVAGWGWSDSVGAISFNSVNCDTDDNGVIDNSDCKDDAGVSLVGEAITPYKVSMNENWILSGWAWSGVGAITFDSAKAGVPPSDPATACGGCLAKVNESDNKVVGWARAIAACDWNGTNCTTNGAGTGTGGWDGWIRLSCETCANPYLVTLSTTNNADGFKEFLGWAWGGDVMIGSVSFNHKNCDLDENGLSDGPGASGNCPAAGTAIAEYQVEKRGAVVSLPIAQFSCDPSSCGIVSADPCECYNDSMALMRLANESEVESEITQSDWLVDGVPAVPDCSAPGRGDCSLKGLSAGAHNVQLTVTNPKGTDVSSKVVTFVKGMEADFSCSATGAAGSWVKCDDPSLRMDQGAVIYLRDDASVPFYSTASQGGVIDSRTWTYNGSVLGFSNPGGSFTTTTLNVSPATIRLTITDDKSIGRIVFKEYNIAAIPLPRWKELPPFK